MDPNASSLLPGQQVKRSPEGKALTKNMEVTVLVDPWQQRPISPSPMAASLTMKSEQGV